MHLVGFILRIERYNQNYVYSTVLIHTKRSKSRTNSDSHKNCQLQNDLTFVEAFRSFRHKNSCLNLVMFLTDTCFVYYTGLFISPSGISELDCATTKTDTAERSISIGRDSLQVFFFVLGALAYFQVPPLGVSREEKWRSQ